MVVVWLFFFLSFVMVVVWLFVLFWSVVIARGAPLAADWWLSDWCLLCYVGGVCCFTFVLCVS